MLHSINATNEFLEKPSKYDAQRLKTEIQDQLLVSYLSQIFQRPGRLVAPNPYQEDAENCLLYVYPQFL
jgi:hypothetical protein